MWIMPSYGRPERLDTMREAPGGLPPSVLVLVNRDDPRLDEYLARQGPPWQIEIIDPGSRCCDALRYIRVDAQSEAFYGILCDDLWPITPGWYSVLESAAGDMGFATPYGEPSFPLLRNTLVIGGEVARLMGSLAPVAVKHNFGDNVWDTIAQEFNLLRPCSEVVVEHRHPLHGTAEPDATYERGSADITTDAVIFRDWFNDRSDSAMYARLSAATGVALATVNPKGLYLVFCLVVGGAFDPAFVRSLLATVLLLVEKGIKFGFCETGMASHVEKGRENVLWNAMREGATHFAFIDSDMGWDPSTLMKLLAASEYHEFCGVPGRKKQDEPHYCINPYPNPQSFHPTTRFLRVRDVGFAFVLLRRAVIDKLCAAYPELQYNAGKHTEFALFDSFIDKTDTALGPYGERLSEDLSFCRRWIACGGEIYVDPDAALVHAGRKEYSGRLRDVLAAAKAVIAEQPMLEAAE